MFTLLDEEKARAFRDQEMQERGEIKGMIKAWFEDLYLTPMEIYQKIIPKYSLEEKDAKDYVEKTLGVTLNLPVAGMAEPAAAYDPEG